jgi:hypothetical protein
VGKELLGDSDDGLESVLHPRSEIIKLTSSMSTRVTFSTLLCLRASRMTPPSPPPTTRTDLGSGCEARGMWAIISWYLACEFLLPLGAGHDLRELVSLGALDDTVEDKDVTVGLGREDKDILFDQP